MKIQKKIILIIIIAIIFIPKTVKAEDNTIETQKETFGINSFIENSKQYTGEFFADADISEILNSAISGKVDNSKIYKKILNILGTAVQTGIKSLLSILAIIIIHSILKSISESLENDSISKLIYYVQYIAIVTIIMSNFSDVINLVKQTSNNLIGFMNTLGYNYIEPTQEQISEGYEIAKNMDSWPNKNSVKFENGLIVVKFN